MDENKLDLIFKAYDVRGVFNETITPKVGFKIGAAFASYVDSNEIIVGHDGRISNNEMFAAISSGIQSVNKKVLYVGMVPTDVVYTLSGIKNLPGLIITASHNPKEYTGLKFCDSGAVAIGQETGLKEIKNLAEKFNDDFNMSELPEMQTLNQLYLEHFKNIVDPSEISDKVKFAIDGGNGVLGAIIEDLSESFDLNFEGLYLEVDGNFDNLEEMIYVEGHLSNTSTKYYGEMTHAMMNHQEYPGSNNGSGLFQVLVGLKMRATYERLTATTVDGKVAAAII